MLAAGLLLAPAADSGSNVVPYLSGIGALLLGMGGVAAWLTARAQRKNYVTTGYQGLSEANAKEAADERAIRLRAEYSRDRWREYAYQLRDELAAHSIVPTAKAPTDHPSEAL